MDPFKKKTLEDSQQSSNAPGMMLGKFEKLRVEAGTEEEDKSQSDNCEKKSDIPIRDSSRNRLQKLSALYSEIEDIPLLNIHRTENKFNEENIEKQTENVLGAKPKRNLGKSSALADLIKSWENNSSRKQQPHDTSSSDNKSKQFKWNIPMRNQIPSEISINKSTTAEIKPGLVLSTAALFETQPEKSESKEKDPAEMSVKERMMLFEGNKGKVPLPKTTFALRRIPAVPSTSFKNVTGKKATFVGVEPSSSDIKDFPDNQVKLKDRVAALFTDTSTISERQIKADRTKQLQEEMKVLTNSFVHKNPKN